MWDAEQFAAYLSVRPISTPKASRILETAQENGILEQAQNNAEDSIRTFLNSLGYEEVVFT
ncbi:MAG: DUF4230 domain-containing protein [Actinomycetota bacterium]|nr:DUF4230 domain-containing protein [Actinomycetota bacterium]